MTRRILLVALAVAALAPAAQAAAPIKVIGSAAATGDASAATATGSATRPAALYVRAYGGDDLNVSTQMTCSRGLSVGTRSRYIPVAESGRLYPLALPMAKPGKCTVAAVVIGTGNTRVQLLARSR